MNKIEGFIKKIEEEVINYRRFLHKNAEVSGQEYQTQKYLINQINKLGLQTHKIKTGIYADLVIDSSYDLIALRADIDALPTTEINTELDYCSVNDGVMHACGHDGHTAILLGTIMTLLQFKDELNVNVRFIFQHDEEDLGGAQDFVKAGVLDDVKEIYGLHLDNSKVAGTVGYKYGQTNAGGDVFKVNVTGTAAHGAYPHEGYDPILCSAQMITSIQQIVSRNISPLDSTVISIGNIHGGEAYNSIPGVVNFEGVIRNLNIDNQTYSFDRLVEICEAIATACRCDVEIEKIPSYPPLYNNDLLVKRFKDLASNIIGEENVIEMQYPTLGLEDFAYYTHEVPACFYKLGSQKLDKDGKVLNAHANDFNFDEDALYYGVLLQSSIILNKEKK